MRTTCKNCWDPLPKSVIGEGKDFCKRKCRIEWIRKHNVKGAKRKYRFGINNRFGTAFDYEGNSV